MMSETTVSPTESECESGVGSTIGISRINDRIDRLFPYPEYRPHQREMLESVYNGIYKDRNVVIVNAPTGSGKSSVVVSALALANSYAPRPKPKVLVAVRTVSQLNIFATELERIRSEKYPALRFSYIVGKGSVCPMKDSVVMSEDIYTMCDRLKKISRIDTGRITDGCLFYKNAIGYQNDEDCEGCDPADLLAADLRETYIHPDKIIDFCGDMCPYEVMVRAAKESDVIIVNYYHIFSAPIRNILFRQLGISEPPIIIIDEAHNVGDTVEDINSLTITSRVVTRAVRDVRSNSFARALEEVNIDPSVLINICRAYQEFLADLQKTCVKYSNYRTPINVKNLIVAIKQAFNAGDEEALKWFCIQAYSRIEEWKYEQVLKQQTTESGEAGVDIGGSVGTVVKFTARLLSYQNDPMYIKMFGKETDSHGIKTYLKLWCIDPSKFLNGIADNSRAMVLMSGTISPTAMYADIFFGDREVDMVNVPFSFPVENRVVFCCTDVTSTYAERKNQKNVDTIYEYIKEMVNIRGNTAVFFTSYSEMTVYAQRLKSDGFQNIYVEPKNSNDAGAILKEFMALPESGSYGTLLAVCGGKFFEGIDYRGESLVGAMTVGLPLTTWDDVTKARNQYYIKKFGRADGTFVAYTLPAVNRAQQALGRVLRTNKDIGILVLCERRYAKNAANSDAFDGLSEWMQEEMQEVTLPEFRVKLTEAKIRLGL